MDFPLTEREVEQIHAASAFLNDAYGQMFIVSAITPDGRSVANPRDLTESTFRQLKDVLYAIRTDVLERPVLTEKHQQDLAVVKAVLGREMLEAQGTAMSHIVQQLDAENPMSETTAHRGRHAIQRTTSVAHTRIQPVFAMMEAKQKAAGLSQDGKSGEGFSTGR